MQLAFSYGLYRMQREMHKHSLTGGKIFLIIFLIKIYYQNYKIIKKYIILIII